MPMNNPHGEFECSVSGQLLLFSARGPWNDETMRNGVVKMSSDISKFEKGTKWAQVSCLYGESLMPPSTFAEHGTCFWTYLLSERKEKLKKNFWYKIWVITISKSAKFIGWEVY